MKIRRKKESLLLPPLLKKVAPKVGARVFIEPEWGIVGQILFKNGKKRYFRYNTLDLNPVGSSDVAKDKDYATFFMRHMKYPVPEGEAFYSNEWCKAIGSKRGINAAYRYARKLGFPVVVKPNSGSQGAGVAFPNNKKEFFRAIRHVFKSDRIALVQKPLMGRDYRIVVLDGDIISAYERTPLCVIGDGRSSIAALLKQKQKDFIAASRDTRIDQKDARLREKLLKQRLTFSSIPSRGQRIFLLDNANLSSGGDSIDVTKKVHPTFKKLAVKLTRDMGLRLSGVDLIVEGDIAEKPQKYWILEINAAPGLDHYAQKGAAQKQIVEKLYLRVLKSLAK